MKISIAPGYTTTCLGLCGTGALVIWPDARIIGYALLLFGALTFLLGVRIEGWHVKIGRHWPKKSPLKIIFDPKNPARRFWSLENNPNPDDPNKNFPPYWEYRVEVKNISSKTVKNVRITVEHVGPLPQRPVHVMFDVTKTYSYDLNPDVGVLVPVVKFDPTPRPGLLALHSALAYGPIKITATAEDILPDTRIFQFDYQRTPAIFP